MGPLISVDDLAQRIADPQLRVVDVRWYLLRPGDGRAAYESGHIPGAIFLDLDTDLAVHEGPGRHPLPAPAEFQARLQAAGIATNSDVVAYDDAGGTIAARLWWMLDNLGHDSVSVLDGGIQAWIAAGHALTRDVPAYAPTTLEFAHQAWSNIVDRQTLATRLRDVTVLDARAWERYRGEVEPIDPAAGHIPTALSAPTAGNLGDDGRFLSADELRLRFEDIGAGDGTVVTYCGSGTTSCHNVIAMRLAGLDDPVLYPGSFSDWSTAGMPVVAGDLPGDPLPMESRK